MRQSGLTPEQLQQNPQLARSAMGNWLGSIGQGMQTGDYTGSRLGYQQEMLTKLQNLQAMKQQDAMKQRLAQYQAAMAQADTPEKIAAVGTQFTEFGDLTKNAMAQYQAVSGMKRDTAATKLDDKQVELMEYKKNNPDLKSIEGIGNYKYAVYQNGTKKLLLGEDGLPVPNTEGRFLNTSLGLFDTENKKYVTPDDKLDESTRDQWNRAWKQAYVQAGGKADVFDKQFLLPSNSSMKFLDEQQNAVKSAIDTINGRAEINARQAIASQSDQGAIDTVARKVAAGLITFEQGASALGGVRARGGSVLATALDKLNQQFLPPKAMGVLQDVNLGRGQIEELRKAVDAVVKAKTPEEKLRATNILEGKGQQLSARMAKANGEVGVLTEGDIKRGGALVPGWKAANFAPDYAYEQIDSMLSSFDAVEKSLRATYYSGGSVPRPPSTPPPAQVDLNKFWK
jgi:hypothetical protein